jgi:phosphoglycerate dehydrogenase-like enzyme
MKPDAILVNVSRANIVDEEALYRHLRGHPEFYAAFDVWWTEPYSHGEFRPRWPILNLPNFMGTPHSAAFVDGFFAERARQAAANVRRYIDGTQPANLVSALPERKRS